MSNCVFDSFLGIHKSPFGAVEIGKEVRISIKLSITSMAEKPCLLVYWDENFNEPKLRIPLILSHTDPTHHWYSASVTPTEARLMFYCFEVTINNMPAYVKNVGRGQGHITNSGYHWQLSAFPAMQTPECMRGVAYQIFPDRFYNSGTKKNNPYTERNINARWGDTPKWKTDAKGTYAPDDYFAGDLEGIRQKLSYIASLGVTAIYLNPIFEAHSNHRYNTADYFKVDPLLGTNEDFRKLCADAQEKGITIILDGVFSHTGSDSVYFNREGRYSGGAYQSKSSPYYKWFKFKNYPAEYQSWWGFESLPEIYEEEESFLEFICGEGGVLEYWLKLGAGGFRLDVADELPDVFLDRIHDAVNRIKPNAPIIGEVWEDASNKSSYGVRRRYLLGSQLNSVMNYPFTKAILAYVRYGSREVFYDNILAVLDNYPKPIIDCLLNSISTHDICRAVTALVGEEIEGHDRKWQGDNNALSAEQISRAKELLKLAAVIQYTLPGTPCLYYGDEAGLYGYKDPLNRGCYPWGQEDTTLIEFFRYLGNLRATSPALQSGDFSFVCISDTLLCYTRTCETQTLKITIDRSNNTYSIV